MAKEMAPISKKSVSSNMENALGAEHPKIILGHTKAPSISTFPTQNGGIRAERVASIDKCARNK